MRKEFEKDALMVDEITLETTTEDSIGMLNEKTTHVFKNNAIDLQEMDHVYSPAAKSIMPGMQSSIEIMDRDLDAQVVFTDEIDHTVRLDGRVNVEDKTERLQAEMWRNGARNRASALSEYSERMGGKKSFGEFMFSPALFPEMTSASNADRIVDEMGEPVIYNNLEILDFPNLEIESFHINSKVNEHSKLVFTAYVDEKDKNALKNVMVCTPIDVVYYSNKKSEIPFFSGMITNVKVYVEDGHQIVQVTALSNSSAMDSVKTSASCQNTGTTYKALMGTVSGKSGASCMYGIGGEAFSSALGAISVQYKETDWEYVRRLASQKNQGLFVDMTKDSPVFSVGALGKLRKDFSAISYEISKDVRTYEIDRANYIDNINDKDYVIYVAESYNILHIGDKVVLEGKELFVREAKYEMKNAIVVGTYVLCSDRGLQQRRIKNTKIQGLSLNGTTMGVERDKIRVQLDIDSESNAEYLFPYSTMAASPDGSGWYCMPQEGDLVRVYFPDDNEANAFAISSASSYTPEAGDANDRMSDPSVVYLRTPDNNVIQLSPDGVMISANEGESIIVMDTAGNITISGANSLSITATNDVNIVAGNNMAIYASENLKLSGQSGSIEMDASGNTRVTGQYVLEN